MEVNTEADKTLMRFLAYRKSDILNEHHHDNAHLITSVLHEFSYFKKL